MAVFRIRIAGEIIEVRSLFESTRDYCAPYLTEEEPDFFVEVTKEDLVRRQELAYAEAKREGLRPRVFPDPFLERETVQAEVARQLLQRNVLLVHGSAVAADGVGYLFCAPCRTGKSTHTRLWRELLGDRAVMINDDKPFLRLEPERILICGSPWSGKHGLHSNIAVPLGGICILERGRENSIFRAGTEDVLPVLLHHGAGPEEEAAQVHYEGLMGQLAARVKLWKMCCTKEPEAARMAWEAMRRDTI